MPVMGDPSTSAPPIAPANLPIGHTPVPPHHSSRHRTVQSHRRRPDHRRGGPPGTATDHQENSPGIQYAPPPLSSRQDAWIPTSTPTSQRCCASTTTSHGHGRSGRPQPALPLARAAWAQIWPSVAAHRCYSPFTPPPSAAAVLPRPEPTSRHRPTLRPGPAGPSRGRKVPRRRQHWPGFARQYVEAAARGGR